MSLLPVRSLVFAVAAVVLAGCAPLQARDVVGTAGTAIKITALESFNAPLGP